MEKFVITAILSLYTQNVQKCPEKSKNVNFWSENPPNLAENVGKYVITALQSFYIQKGSKVPRKVKKC